MSSARRQTTTAFPEHNLAFFWALAAPSDAQENELLPRSCLPCNHPHESEFDLGGHACRGRFATSPLLHASSKRDCGRQPQLAAQGRQGPYDR